MSYTSLKLNNTNLKSKFKRSFLLFSFVDNRKKTQNATPLLRGMRKKIKIKIKNPFPNSTSKNIKTTIKKLLKN